MIPCKLCRVNDGQPEICVDCATPIDARRTVGAIIRAKSDGFDFIVIKAGEGEHSVRALDVYDLTAGGYTKADDVFQRWATQEECKRHGIPYVERAKPNTSAPGAKKHSGWCPASKSDGGGISNCLCSPASLPKWVRITSLNGVPGNRLTVSKVYAVQGWDPDAGSPRVTGDDGHSKWLSDQGTKPDRMYSTFASWEPAEDPRARQWIPKVGDQVRIKEDYADFCSMRAGTEFIVTSLVTTDKEPKDYEVYGLSTGQYVRVRNLEPSKTAPYIPKVGDVVEFGARTSKNEQGVVVAVNTACYEDANFSSVNIVMFGEKPTDKPWCRYFFHIKYLRPATKEERIAAGLDVRPEMVRILSLPGEGKLQENDMYMVEVGEVYRVVNWDNRGSPEVNGASQFRVTLSSKGASIDPDRQYYATWEPA